MRGMFLAGFLGLFSPLGGLGIATAQRRVARAARTLSVHDEGHLVFKRASGSLLLDEGHVTGSFPALVKARFVYDGQPTVSAQLTISGTGGTISARGTGRLSSPTSPTPSFKGSLRVTGGSGRYAHIRGAGELFGVYNRRNYGLTVQAIAKLPY
jgi:hypothetical protein